MDEIARAVVERAFASAEGKRLGLDLKCPVCERAGNATKRTWTPLGSSRAEGDALVVTLKHDACGATLRFLTSDGQVLTPAS